MWLGGHTWRTDSSCSCRVRGMWGAAARWMASAARCISTVTRQRTRSASASLCPVGLVYAYPFASLPRSQSGQDSYECCEEKALHCHTVLALPPSQWLPQLYPLSRNECCLITQHSFTLALCHPQKVGRWDTNPTIRIHLWLDACYQQKITVGCHPAHDSLQRLW